MQITKVALLAATLFAAGTASAFHCPQDMKKIDEAMAKNPPLTAEQTDEVKKYRAEGEALHKAGKHQDRSTRLPRPRRSSAFDGKIVRHGQVTPAGRCSAGVFRYPGVDWCLKCRTHGRSR